MTMGNTPTAGKAKRGLIVVLIAANLIMLTIGILTIPANIRGSMEKGTTTPSTEQAAPINTIEVTPDENADVVTPSASNGNQGSDISLSTQERPNLEDFLWYTEDVLYNGVPVDNAPINRFYEATGGWKALIVYDPDNTYDANAMEFLNISVGGTEDDLNLTLDWYLIFWSGEGNSVDETNMDDAVFNGKWENDGLWASGAGTIRLTQFYSLGNKQYAIGTMDTPDGIPAFIALVRP